MDERCVGLKFDSLWYAYEWSGTHPRVIVDCIRNRIKTDGKYKWRLV